MAYYSRWQEEEEEAVNWTEAISVIGRLNLYRRISVDIAFYYKVSDGDFCN